MQRPTGKLIEGVASAEQVRRVELTAVQVRALNSTPQELIPAPGTGKMIVIGRGVVLSIAAGTAYGGAGTLRVRYDNSSTDLVGTINGSGFLTSGSAQKRFSYREDAALGNAALPENTSVELSSSVARSGGRRLVVEIYYYTIKV